MKASLALRLKLIVVFGKATASGHAGWAKGYVQRAILAEAFRQQV